MTACGEDDTDAADVRLRESSAQVQVVRAEGIRIDNTALTPYVEVSRPGTTDDPLKWRIDLANGGSAGQISEPDVIDQLPTVGVRGTDDNGSLRFVSATDDANDTRLTIWYTSNPNLSLDPADPSNAPGGSTVWCDAPSGGSPVLREASGDRATPADCPHTAADVTGLRIRAGRRHDGRAAPCPETCSASTSRCCRRATSRETSTTTVSRAGSPGG